MKRFKFRLERVLQFRKRVREGKLKVLLEKNQEVSNLEQRLSDLVRAQLSNTVENTNFDSRLLEIQNLYGQRLRAEIFSTNESLENAQNEAKLALNEYMEASKEEKVLVSLRNKREQEYLEIIEKHEQAVLDEISIQKGNQMLNSEEVRS